MSKKQNPISPAPPQQKRTASQTIQSHTVQSYQGAIPPPQWLEHYDKINPGTAQQLIDMAIAESIHRRENENKAMQANIAAQKKQLEINEYHARKTYLSDTLGQVAGFAVCVGCIVAAVYLGLNNHEYTAVAIAAIPTGTIFSAFLFRKKKTMQQ